MSNIKAISFDLWDTILIDESDEPKRAAAGMLSKPKQRRQLVFEILNRDSDVTMEAIESAYMVTDAAFREIWYGRSITLDVPERMRILLKGLSCELKTTDFDELVRLHEEMEVGCPPDIVDGIEDALIAIQGAGIKIGVISDTIFSPGRCLRELLDHYGLLGYFECFVFSDEHGFSKPKASCFEAIATGLGVDVSELVHIGDRQEKDIVGPQAIGAKAILFPTIKDRGGENCTADATCHNYKNLLEIIQGL